MGGNDLELAIEMVENIPGEFDRPPISRRQTELERDKWQGDETRVPYPNFPPRLKNKLEGTGWRSGERNRGRGLSALGFGIFALLLPFKSSLPFDRLRIEKWRSLVFDENLFKTRDFRFRKKLENCFSFLFFSLATLLMIFKERREYRNRLETDIEIKVLLQQD